jgi:hypothetical protein
MKVIDVAADAVNAYDADIDDPADPNKLVDPVKYVGSDSVDSPIELLLTSKYCA